MSELTVRDDGLAVDAQGWVYEKVDGRWSLYFGWAEFEAKVFKGHDPKVKTPKKPKRGKKS